ncbi:MAG: glycine cleavage system protein H [Actinomycetota bacterium]|nr:glycine cleavage system protein H [Actinomycetota bacterium]
MGDQNWYGCTVPEDLLYDVDRNIWVRWEDGVATLGMTDVAQTLCGRLVQVSWKPVGKRVAQGRPLAVIESAKWVGPFPAPFSGEIVEVNSAAFEADVAVANRDPYGAGWLVRLRPSNFEGESAHLVDGPAAFQQYQRMIDEQGIRCFRCEE